MRKLAIGTLALMFALFGFCIWAVIDTLEFNRESTSTQTDATMTDATPTDTITDIEVEEDKKLALIDIEHFRYQMSLKKPEHIAQMEQEYKDNQIVYTPKPTSTYTVTSNTTTNYVPPSDDGVLTPSKGVNYYGNQKETYYNLNMNGVIANAKNMGIEGEYWVRDDGAKMYGDYVIVAANLNTHPRGSIVETSLGEGIVLDTGGFAASNPNQVDIACDW